MSERHAAAHSGCFSIDYKFKSCSIFKCVHFVIVKKKKTCNDVTVLETSRWQQSVMLLALWDHFKEKKKKKKKDHHIYCILY